MSHILLISFQIHQNRIYNHICWGCLWQCKETVWTRNKRRIVGVNIFDIKNFVLTMFCLQGVFFWVCTGYYKYAVVLCIHYPLVLTIIIPNKQVTAIIIALQTCRKHNYYFYHCNSQIVFFVIKTRSNSLLEVARHCLHFTRRLHTSYA
jgi:hypothetical protein